jgi:hypothetical protein
MGKAFAETSHNGNEDLAECPAFMNHDPPCPDFHFTTAGDRSTNQHTKPREGCGTPSDLQMKENFLRAQPPSYNKVTSLLQHFSSMNIPDELLHLIT